MRRPKNYYRSFAINGGTAAVFGIFLMAISASFTFAQVLPLPTATITLAPIQNQSVIEGQTINFIVTATDSDPHGVITYFYAASTTSSYSATLDPFSGRFSWDTTGITPGVYGFNVQSIGNTGGFAIYNVFIKIVSQSSISADLCKKGGWVTFTAPYFKNQGQCVSYMTSNIE